MSMRDIPPDLSQQLRIPPSSVEAESSVLGSILLDNSSFDRVADILLASDFYRHEHRLIFAAVADLIGANKPADVITVYERLERDGKGEEVGGLIGLNNMAQFVSSAVNIRRYAEIVRERAVLRKLIAASDEAATAAFNPGGNSVADIVDKAQAAMLALAQDGATDDWQSLGELVIQELDAIQDRADGTERTKDFIPTGLAALDNLLDGGPRPGQLIVIGARPGMGKSALAQTIGLHVARDLGIPVGVFNMEMQNAESGQRAIASTAKVPLHAVRRPERMTDEHWTRLTTGVEILGRVPFFTTDKAGLNILQVRSKTRMLARKCGVKLLVVDYLQLMAGTDPKMSRAYQLEEVSRGLKTLAKELRVPVIALAQVNRSVERQEDAMPRLSDLKDCGSIEQDADVVLFLHREIQAKPTLIDPEWKYYASAHLAKQRGGRNGKFDLMYIGEHMQFLDWPVDKPVPTDKSLGRPTAHPSHSL